MLHVTKRGTRTEVGEGVLRVMKVMMVVMVMKMMVKMMVTVMTMTMR